MRDLEPSPLLRDENDNCCSSQANSQSIRVLTRPKNLELTKSWPCELKPELKAIKGLNIMTEPKPRIKPGYGNACPSTHNTAHKFQLEHFTLTATTSQAFLGHALVKIENSKGEPVGERHLTLHKLDTKEKGCSQTKGMPRSGRMQLPVVRG